MIVDKINSYLTAIKSGLESNTFGFAEAAEYSFTRQFLTPDPEVEKGKLRLSAAGKCARQLAYGYHGFEKNGKKIDARSKIVFFTGDIAEVMVISLAKLAGCAITHTGKDQLEIDVNGITGHPDGLLGSDYIVEVKSMSSFSFKRFEQGEIEDSYLAQINMYLTAFDRSRAVIVALNKDSGVLAEQIVRVDPDIVLKTKNNLKTVLLSTPSNLPDRAYAPAENGQLPWQCVYCAYHQTCWPKAEKVLKGNAYILKIKKEKING